MDDGHGSHERIRKVCGLVQSMSVLIPEAGCELDEATYDTIMTLGVLEAARSCLYGRKSKDIWRYME